MKTYGLIWPNGEKELRSIALDDEGSPRIDTLQPNPMTDDWQAPQIIPLVKLPQPDQGTWEPNVVWFDDRVERQWVAGTPAPAPTYTPEAWVTHQDFAGQRPTTLLYLKLQLDAAQKSSPKLAAVQAWLDGMIVAGVTNPSEVRSDWPVAPYSFQEASGEALAGLSSQNLET